MSDERATDPVVIVGAGPAGMLLAWLLATRGVPVHVVERHADFKREFRGEGIQASVVRHLEDLGLLEERLLQLPGYRATLGATVRDLDRDGDRVIGVRATTERGEVRIRGSLVVVATGRGTALRKAAGLEARSVDTHFNILWLRLPGPADPSLVPSGFRAYLTGDSLFIVHPTEGGNLQMAWGRRDEGVLKDPDHGRKKARLLDEAPRPYRALVAAHYQPSTRTQFLRVQCDRLARWSVPGALFIGDAAHTMSPVAGQGINLAMRDSIALAHHLLARRDAGGAWDEALGARLQAEREPEIRAMQTFQRRLGYFMLGAPRWQIRLFFRVILRVLTALGIRQRLLRRVQGGVADIRIDDAAASASRRAVQALVPSATTTTQGASP